MCRCECLTCDMCRCECLTCGMCRCESLTCDSGCDRLDQLEQCASLFSRLQVDFYEEYRVYELSTLAAAVVYPLVMSLYTTVYRW